MKRINILFCLSIFGLSLTACGGDGPSEGDPSHVHEWGNPTYQWSSDYSKCTAQRVCELVTSHVDKETANSVVTDQKSPTETEDGFKEYTATFTNEAFETQVHVEVIYATGHEHTYSNSWSFDETYHWHASTCGHDVVKDKGEHHFVDTLGDDGSLVHTCSTCEYSYSEGGTSDEFPYMDNTSIPTVLNNIFKSVFSQDNFTLEKNQAYENVVISAGHSTIPEGMPDYHEAIENLKKAYEAGELTAEEYKEQVMQLEQLYSQFGVKYDMTVNGTFTSFIKIVGREGEIGRQFTGEITAQLSDILQTYNKASWNEFINDVSAVKLLIDDVRTGISSSEHTQLNAFDLADPTLNGNKVVIMGNSRSVISEFYDEELGQFYFKGEPVPGGYLYVAPNGMYFSQLDFLYSPLELYRYAIYELNASQVHYDSENHCYTKEYWGTGGGSSVFTLYEIFPVVVDGGELVTMGGMTLKDVGATVISTSREVGTCAHPNGGAVAWYDKSFHADYCYDCGRKIATHAHECHNEHDYCKVCSSFKDPKAFVPYDAPYANEITGAYNVMINKATGKKYASYSAYGTDVPAITGTDGKLYKYFPVAPVNGEKDKYWVEVVTHGQGAEDTYIQADSCVYCEQLVVYKQTVNASYLQLSEDVIPAEYQNRLVDPDHYYYVDETVISAIEAVDTLYTYPQVYHDDITLSSYQILNVGDAMRKIPAVYSKIQMYATYGQLEHIEQYRFLMSTCDRCGETIFACIAAPDGQYMFNVGAIYDANGCQTSKAVRISYKWGDNYESCTGTMVLENIYGGGTPVVISTENAEVINNTEESIIVALFSKPEFENQESPYYGD